MSDEAFIFLLHLAALRGRLFEREQGVYVTAGEIVQARQCVRERAAHLIGFGS